MEYRFLTYSFTCATATNLSTEHHYNIDEPTYRNGHILGTILRPRTRYAVNDRRHILCIPQVSPVNRYA